MGPAGQQLARAWASEAGRMGNGLCYASGYWAGARGMGRARGTGGGGGLAEVLGFGPDGEGGRGLEGRREWFGPSTGWAGLGFLFLPLFYFLFFFSN